MPPPQAGEKKMTDPITSDAAQGQGQNRPTGAAAHDAAEGAAPPANSSRESDHPGPGGNADALAAAQTFIRALYHTLLDRSPGEAEFRDWTQAMLGGLGRNEVRRAFLASAEYQSRREADALTEFVRNSGLFDSAWYLRAYPDVAQAGLDPLQHYCTFGRTEGRGPNAWFNAPWYRATHGIVSDEDMLLHYAREGEAANLAPGPDFDPGWYRRAYALPADVPVLAHFLHHRGERRFAPCARLWSVLGLPAGEDASGDPFRHFVDSQAASDQPPTADTALLAASGLFDANFYALHSDDVFEAHVDPLEHFCRFGWQEGRDPNFYFKTTWYAATNPEVTRLGVNPLVHYLLAGEPAGRRPIVYFDPAWYRDHYGLGDGTSPLAHYLANRRGQQFAPNNLFDPAWYLAQPGVAVHARRDPFSHFLVAGIHQDVSPSATFDMAAWRRQTRGRPSRHFKRQQNPEMDNPLVNYLLSTYA